MSSRSPRKRKVRTWFQDDSPMHGDNINWKGWGANRIVEILNELRKQFEIPTVRGVWYILVSRYPKYIANVKSIYQSYDSITVKCRNGQVGYPRISQDAFSDDTRRILDIDNDEFISGVDSAEGTIQSVKDARERYHIPRWYMQPNYVELWIEKNTMQRFLQRILRGGLMSDDPVDRQIRIAANRGWSSFTFVKENIDRLVDKWEAKWIELGSVSGKVETYPQIWVLYCGDLDPSGCRMDEGLEANIRGRFHNWFTYKIGRDPNIPPQKHIEELDNRMSRIHFVRLAVTIPQIEEFNLQELQDPSPDVQLKLEGGWSEKLGRHKKGDPNAAWFMKQFGNGKVFQIELDAMYARREQFRTMVLEFLDGKPNEWNKDVLEGGLFDWKIYKEHVTDKLEAEQDALTWRLRDKLIHERIELPGWSKIRYRMRKFETFMTETRWRDAYMQYM
ncbi:MAG: hypothetical protein WBX01_06465, partial [Nitrososphaeraceae archaeon]